MTLDVGTQLGPYEILSPLGAGGMGEVYLASDSKLDRKVAIKVLPADVASTSERLQRFEREAKTVAALNHPNIVTIYGIEESGDHHFIAMELVDGAALDRMIPPGGMSLARLFDIAIPIADALAAAHDQGIVHRDLKPANVMVTPENRVKVLDFGLAKPANAGHGGSSPADATVSAPITGRGMILGTVPYMSPEQLKSKPLDHRTDIFSLGIMLYEMASGMRPFVGDDSATVMTSILRDTPRPVQELNSVLPRHLGRIVARCLKKDPDERYQTARDVRNELRELRGEVDSGGDVSESQPASAQTTAVPPPSSAASTSMSGSALSAPTRRGEFWIGVVVVIAAIAAGVWWMGRDETGPTHVANVRSATGAGAGAASSTEVALPPSAPSGASIMLAVLPFKNLGSPDDEYFSDGISDEIRGRLAKVRQLGVISRSSAFQYKNKAKTNRQIGSELGVAYLIDGTIRWDKRGGGEGRVRITPELIRISDDMSLWSQPYDRQTEDIFEVQSEIAAEVLKQLEVTLLEPERQEIEVKPTENSAAYHAYLRGLVYLGQIDWLEEEFRLAIQMFERAVSLDPDFALAYAQLSEAHSAMHLFGHDTTDERAVQAKAAADRALELQPDLPEAHVALGVYYYRCHRDYDRSLDALRIAQKNLPNNSDVLDCIAYNLRRKGQCAEAIGYLKRAFESSPLNSILANEIGETYAMQRNYAEALPWYDKALSLAPDQLRSYDSKVRLYWLWHGDTDLARATLVDMPVRRTAESIFIWFQQELLERNYPAAVDRLASYPNEILVHQLRFAPADMLAGFVYELMGEAERSRAAYEAARIVLEAEAENSPDDHRVRSSLGIVYAGLGRKADAVREGRRGVDLFPVSKDALLGPYREQDLAFIYAQVGEYDLALDKLEYLLSIPGRTLSVQMIRLDPRWDPLRDQPRYKALMRSHGLEPESRPARASAASNKTMLAVLPFANLSGDPEQEYFSDGMTEEMITHLGRLRPERLGVIARTSAMRYKNTDKLIDQIGSELGVDYVIEGGVRRSGDNVRINVQLIQVSDQTQLWGDSYTRGLADVFAVQAEVAEAVAESLAVELLPQDGGAEALTPTANSAAYDAYLLGRSEWAKRTPEALYAAIGHFNRAIELDPTYARAYSGLADAWGVLPWYVPGPYEDMNAEAQRAAEKAYALDDALAESSASMANTLERQGDFEAASSYYRRAIAIDPNNATTRQWYGQTLSLQGRFDKARVQFERAVELDPLAAVTRLSFGGCMRLGRRWDMAVEQLTKAIDLQPNLGGVGHELTLTYLGKADDASAAAAFARHMGVLGQSSDRIEHFNRSYETVGMKAALLEWLDSFGEEDALPHGAGSHAELLAWCGAKDQAFKRLEHAVRQRDPYILYIKTSHAYDGLRDDPRWDDLLIEAGLANTSSENPTAPP